MLTITINWKTYTQKPIDWGYEIIQQIHNWIEKWFLMEEENKTSSFSWTQESDDLFKTEETDWEENFSHIWTEERPHEPCTWWLPKEEADRLTQFWDEENEKRFPWYKKDKEQRYKELDNLFKSAWVQKPLIERIKEWIKEKERLYGDADISGTYPDWAMTILGWLQDLIDEQEEKENKVINKKDTELWMHETFVKPTLSKDWSPTPWELIEVSNDGKEWMKRKYHSKNNRIWCEAEEEDFWKYTDSYWRTTSHWLYARPLQEELPEVPDYTWEIPSGLMQADPTIYGQVRNLTLFCQHLRKELSRNK